MKRLTILAMLVAIMAGGAHAADPPAAPAAAASTLGPQELVENSAKRMLVELDKNRSMYKADPTKLDALVANVLLPNFDTEYAARLVLGQTWRTATPDQRKRFVDGFYHSLLRNYGAALVDFTADRFVILPYKSEACEKSTGYGRPGMWSSRASPTSKASVRISRRRFNRRDWMKSSLASNRVPNPVPARQPAIDRETRA
jgi:ABC-type transporter MlaC component